MSYGLTDKEAAYVEKQLRDRVICAKCQATLATYAEKCSADLSEPCPGFLRIELARSDLRKAQ